jgi:hypothetical protein
MTAGLVPFELSWLGGATERHFRKLRPGIDELPWGTLKPEQYPPLLLERARIAWTEGAYNEYCTALAFADLQRALLQAQVPIDLIGMASDFVVDEILHIELSSRVAMELGGAAPYRLDLDALQPERKDCAPLELANELMIRLCCVGEAFSVPMLAGSMKSASHPLTKAVLKRIVKDEAPHGQLGWHYLEWAQAFLSDAERKRLAEVAITALQDFSPLWQRLKSTAKDGVTSEGFLLSDVRELGWMESSEYAQAARHAVRHEIAEPLASFGIVLPEEQLEALLV